jgi:hypothetical protein
LKQINNASAVRATINKVPKKNDLCIRATVTFDTLKRVFKHAKLSVYVTDCVDGRRHEGLLEYR